jgi:hypothetical protein
MYHNREWKNVYQIIDGIIELFKQFLEKLLKKIRKLRIREIEFETLPFIYIFGYLFGYLWEFIYIKYFI